MSLKRAIAEIPTIRIVLCAALLSAPAIAAAQAQGQPAGKLIYAQKLINQTLARHPDVIVMAFHVTPPHQSENVIVASNIGRIGKKADADDLRVIETGTSSLEVNKTGDRFEDELPLLDRSGQIIGAVGIVFHYKQGDDKQKLVTIAESIRNEMRRQIPSRNKLFEPVTAD